MVGACLLLWEEAPRSQGGLISPKGIDSSAQGTTLGTPSSAATLAAHPKYQPAVPCSHFVSSAPARHSYSLGCSH